MTPQSKMEAYYAKHKKKNIQKYLKLTRDDFARNTSELYSKGARIPPIRASYNLNSSQLICIFYVINY